MFGKILIRMWLVVSIIAFSGCDKILNPEDESNIEPANETVLNTIITQGPEDGAELLYHASPLFKWRGEISPGYISGFQWVLELDEETFFESDGYTMEMMKSFESLENGNYTFTVTAMDEKDSTDATPAVITFSVKAADTEAPVVRFIESPKDSSYKAPGSHIVFEWTASDHSVFGSVEGYSYRLNGTGSSATDWSDYDLSSTTAIYSDLQTGVYDFQVKAKDNSGLESTPSSVRITVKDPTVLIVDDYIPGIDPFMNEKNTDYIMSDILRDWAVQEWDVNTLGMPAASDLLGYSTVVWYVDDDPMSFYYFASGDEENPIDDFLDAGGNLWLMGSEIIYYTEFIEEDSAFYAGHFLKDYLHLDGGMDADFNEFTGLDALATPVEGFNNIGIPGLATGTGYPDILDPSDEAVPVYDLGGYDAGSTAGILYDGNDHKVVFWSVNFGFVATNGNHLTLDPVDVYPVANHIMANIFGE